MTTFDDRLQAAWLVQLTREYNDICFQRRLDLTPPILLINHDRRQLGSWSAGDRILRLSETLIREHPWSLTLRILKHEMAHQICSELQACPDAGHGPLFRQACDRLGLEPAFQRAGADLSESLTTLDPGSVITRQGRQIIDKVRKLLALGGSDNEHEAALAVRRASELLARHRLDLDALAETEGLVHRSINTGSRTLPAHRKTICALLEQSFLVRVICASTYDPLADVSLRTLELLGREEDVAIAEHCYRFLEERLETLWRTHRRTFAASGRTARRSYFLGLLAGFRQTLEQGRSDRGRTESGQNASSCPPLSAPKAQPSHLPALSLEQRLEQFVASRFPRLRRLRGRGLAMDPKAYQQAMADGRNLTLHPPVRNDSGPVRLLS
jgi:hypothetical protein